MTAWTRLPIGRRRARYRWEARRPLLLASEPFDGNVGARSYRPYEGRRSERHRIGGAKLALGSVVVAEAKAGARQRGRGGGQAGARQRGRGGGQAGARRRGRGSVRFWDPCEV
jgi:hypothetical protein